MSLPNPVCNCCSCEISTDTFTTSIGGKWTQVSGSWAISSNRLAGTGAGMIYDTTVHPGGSSGNMSVVVTIRFTAAAGDNILRVLIGFLDDDNYLYAEFGRRASGCDYIQLGEVVAGADSDLTEEVPLEDKNLNTNYTVYVCYHYDQQTLRARMLNDGAGVQADATALGDKAGFEITSGDATFDDYAFGHAGTDTTRVDCENCNGDCVIGGADFTAGSSIDTCFWTSVSGSWSFSSGYLATGDSILRYNRMHPTGKSHMRVRAETTDMSIGETMRVYVNWLDSSNHLYAELEFTSTTTQKLSLYSVSGGSGTLLDERFSTGTTGTAPFQGSLEVCFDGTRLGARGAGFSSPGSGGSGFVSGAASAAATEIAGGVYPAIGSGGGVTFRTFNFDKRYSESEPGETDCNFCTETCGCVHESMPIAAYKVDLGAGGWTNDHCDYCTSVLGEYVFPTDVLDTSCASNYFEIDVCTPVGCTNCPATMRFDITLTLVTVSSTTMKWTVTATLGFLVIGDPTCTCQVLSQVEYESAVFPHDECHVVPVTLSRVSSTDGDACDGNLPATITLDSA